MGALGGRAEPTQGAPVFCVPPALDMGGQGGLGRFLRRECWPSPRYKGAMLLLLYLALGALAGTMAGLFGIGGGLVIVPTLVFAFRAQGFDTEVLTHMAIGTSLATIVVTAVSSLRAHHQELGVRWDLFWRLTPGIVAGVMGGAWLAAALSGAALQVAIGIYAVVTAWKMGLGKSPNPSRELPGTIGLFASGGLIGAISAICGLGGGSLTVPFLYWCNVPIAQAAGTAAACGFPLAVFGAATNVWAGWGRAGLPPWSSGYVYWPATLGIVLMSTPCARLGAKLAHRLPALRLRRGFAIFLLFVGASFFYAVWAA